MEQMSYVYDIRHEYRLLLLMLVLFSQWRSYMNYAVDTHHWADY